MPGQRIKVFEGTNAVQAVWLAGWLAGCLASLLAGKLAGWLAGKLAGWLADWLAAAGSEKLTSLEDLGPERNFSPPVLRRFCPPDVKLLSSGA